MIELVESRYGFIYVEHRRNHHYIDLYLPKSMLTQLQLVPGSGVLVQGLESRSSEALQLRPAKGSEKYRGVFPFVSTIRFRNQRGVLREFLSSARDRGIQFELLNTRGLRGVGMTDVLCEGVVSRKVPYFDPGKAIGAELAKAAKSAGGDVLAAFPIDYNKPKNGKVLFSSYRTNIPFFRGIYGKVRVDMQGKGRPLKHLESEINMLRVELDPLRLTLTLDLAFADHHAYLLSYNAIDVDPASPVTQTILEVMLSDEDFKVEAIEAFEYPEYRASTLTPPDEEPIRQTARIEVLFTKDSPIENTSSLGALVATKLREEKWCSESFDIEILDLRDVLDKKVEREIPEDTGCSAFQKLLKSERYVFIERIGVGAFGSVSKYFDNRENRLVAGKHITDPQFAADSKIFVDAEIRALELAAKEGGLKNLVSILDYFYDGEMPFIVMELVQNILENHSVNPASSGSAKRHSMPSDIFQFIDMTMQILRALHWLHTGGEMPAASDSGPKKSAGGKAEVSGEGVLHSDIKPSNIGFDVLGSEIVWKLLDFGLAKRLPRAAFEEETTRIAGTPAYMSPQALLGRKLESNDVYALGIVLFQAAFGWQHPSAEYSGADERLSDLTPLGPLLTPAEPLSFVPEVMRYAVFARNRRTEKATKAIRPPGFLRKALRFSIYFPEDFDDRGRTELVDIIYKMIEFSIVDRHKTAGEALRAFEDWGSRYLSQK